MQDYKKLRVWVKAHELTLAVYKATGDFPVDERYGLTNQMRCSCASIPTNIAEGCGRQSSAELLHFLSISMGSACELEYQLLLSMDLGYLIDSNYTDLNDRVIAIKQMISSFIRKLKEEK